MILVKNRWQSREMELRKMIEAVIKNFLNRIAIVLEEKCGNSFKGTNRSYKHRTGHFLPKKNFLKKIVYTSKNYLPLATFSIFWFCICNKTSWGNNKLNNIAFPILDSRIERNHNQVDPSHPYLRTQKKRRKALNHF